ncbi:uncharacterized protein BX664DRAFT_332538 [Halteromyces radiatus]|uniref:uncharacterized protein n=1 Tax=Halteromyces radiatus TaxID=101107 RepID=UPI00221EF281|nr:uncharacterized protein BX664DRAFT_332538 [Halteromyces radiatus]KAI8089257.1 hypothetical protein BX664DRAFT_332538 [Halteromyces radiatus]
MAFRLLTRSIGQPVIRTPISSCLYTTTSTEASSASKFADSVTKKFIGQAKKGQIGRRFNTPSKFVIIEDLPSTATTEDVRKLAREAFSQGDKSIRETIFCRNYEFKFFGRCVVMMDSEENACKLLDYGNRRLVGGQAIKMNFAGNESKNSNEFINKLRRPELVSMADTTSAAGRSVILTGLPPKTKRDQVLGILRSKNLFPVEGVSDNVISLRTKNQSTVSKFLIKFDSEPEAWRCVRAFHNTNFNLKQKNSDYRLSVSVAY